MKLILIEDKVYRVKNKDYNELEDIAWSLCECKMDDRLDDIERRYKPIMVLDNLYNYTGNPE